MNKQQLTEKLNLAYTEKAELVRVKDAMADQIEGLKFYAEKADKEVERLKATIRELEQFKYVKRDLDDANKRIEDALAIIEAQYFIKTGMAYGCDESAKNARFLVALHRALREECPF